MGLKQGHPYAPFLFLLVTKCFTGFIRSVVTRNRFSGLRTGSLVVEISHYVVDTLLIGEQNVGNLCILKLGLRSFEMAFGFMVKFLMSCLLGVNVEDFFTMMAASFLQYRIGGVPFK